MVSYEQESRKTILKQTILDLKEKKEANNSWKYSEKKTLKQTSNPE